MSQHSPNKNTLGAPMMTSEEVTRYLRISYAKLKNLINAGEIPAIRVGREIRFRQSDIEDWVNNNYINKPDSAKAA